MDKILLKILKIIAKAIGNYMGFPPLFVLFVIILAPILLIIFLAYLMVSLSLVLFNVGVDIFRNHHQLLGLLYFICLVNVVIFPLIEKSRKERYKKTWRRKWKIMWQLTPEWESYIGGISLIILVVFWFLEWEFIKLYIEDKFEIFL